MRQIVHVDMDAFFASVEQLDDPSLRGKPILVGGSRRRGVVAAASYEARPFGARSAMPMAQALRLCPTAIVRPPRMARYSAVSDQVFAIFEQYTPLVEGLSFDEAFLDVTQSRALFGGGEEIAQCIRRDIQSRVGLTASAGVATCKFVAKIASDMNKPDGLTVVRGDAAAFLAPLPIERMWGVGKVAAKSLRSRGFQTIGDLAVADITVLRSLLGSWGEEVHQLARGLDDRDVIPDREAKSVGAEMTFEYDLVRRDDVEHQLFAQCQRVAQRLVRSGLAGRVVTVKLKYADFTLRSKQTRLGAPAMDIDTIYAAVRQLLTKFSLDDHSAIRLTGVSVSDFDSRSTQQELFVDPTTKRREKIETLTAAIGDRFGAAGITRASLIDPPTRRKPS
jgi:DNA polymerase-4